MKKKPKGPFRKVDYNLRVPRGGKLTWARPVQTGWQPTGSSVESSQPDADGVTRMAEGGTLFGEIEGIGTKIQPAIDNLSRWHDFTQTLSSPVWQTALSGLSTAIGIMGETGSKTGSSGTSRGA